MSRYVRSRMRPIQREPDTNLTKAFRALRKAGYFARQNYSCCQDCAVIPSEYVNRYVFYTREEYKEQKHFSGWIDLAWKGDSQEIVRSLQDNGLFVIWNGEDSQCMEVGENAVARLFMASLAGDLQAVRSLLLAGVDPNTPKSHGLGALHVASTPAIARLLIEHGAQVDVNARNTTPLQTLVLSGRLEVVKVVVEAGADIEAQLNEWASPYELAVAQEHHEIAAYLLALKQQKSLAQGTIKARSNELKSIRL